MLIALNSSLMIPLNIILIAKYIKVNMTLIAELLRNIFLIVGRLRDIKVWEGAIKGHKCPVWAFSESVCDECMCNDNYTTYLNLPRHLTRLCHI